MPVKIIKSQARLMLRGHRLTLAAGICMMLFLMLALGLCEYIFRIMSGINAFASPGLSAAVSCAGLVLQYAAVSPLVYGIWRYLRLLSESRTVKTGDLFIFYSSGKMFLRAVTACFAILFRKAAYMLLLFLPPALISFFINLPDSGLSGGTNSTIYTLLFAFTAAARICAVLIYAVVMLRYSLSGMMISSEKGSVCRTINRSVKAVKGHKGYILALTLSFAGWFMLCLFVFPALFVLPYFWGCLAVYTRRVSCAA